MANQIKIKYQGNDITYHDSKTNIVKMTQIISTFIMLKLLNVEINNFYFNCIRVRVSSHRKCVHASRE